MYSNPSDLLENLIKLGFIAEEDLIEIRKQADSRGISILEAALLGNRLNIDARGWIIAAAIGIPFMDVDPDSVPLELAQVLPENVARENFLAPFSREGLQLTVAVSDPFRHMAFSFIEEMTGMSVRIVVCPRRKISKIIARLYPEQNEFASTEISGGVVSHEEVANWVAHGGLHRLIERTLIRSSAKGITGLRIYPMGNKLVVEGQNADGSCVRLLSGPLDRREEVMETCLGLASAVEHSSGLNEKVFSIETSVGLTACRASFIRGLSGPEVIVKILPELRTGISLDNIGLNVAQFAIARKALVSGTGGMSLVSSPGAEGRATTLYAMVRQLYEPGLRVVTVEDRHCFRTEGYIQILLGQVKGGFNGDWSLLAESLEPDILMVESISDPGDLAQLVHLAKKGISVLCGIRSLNFERTLRTILTLEVDPFTLAYVMRLAMHQRLVKLLCVRCRRSVPAKPSLNMAGRRKAEMEQIIRESDFYLPAGCQDCNGVGYSGKMAMIEMVPFTPGVGNIIVSDMGIEGKMSLILSEDYYPAVESVYDLLRRGMITYDDILPFL